MQAVNNEFFNKFAKEYDQDPNCSQGVDIGKAILRELGSLLDKSKTVAMDFGCGTGLVSQQMYPHVHQLVGVDASKGMVEVYNEKFAKHEIDNAHAECVELTAAESDGSNGEKWVFKDQLDGKRFDLIFTSMAWHHVENIDMMAWILKNYLKDGGKLVVADIRKNGEQNTSNSDESDKHAHKAHGHQHQHHHQQHESHGASHLDGSHTVTHHGGFTDQEITKNLQQAGLKDIETRMLITITMKKEEQSKGVSMDISMAIGTRRD
ncbi:hypothetical protein K7432_014991 [Basidiobolus ranarum]|uniref:S-adenosyl-L-methionine-dependent methyltransferase n=1 Tax=Basidiobolus ranarum TaxID=34480 RepID=A0ABR2WGP8_9FUNG